MNYSVMVFLICLCSSFFSFFFLSLCIDQVTQHFIMEVANLNTRILLRPVPAEGSQKKLVWSV